MSPEPILLRENLSLGRKRINIHTEVEEETEWNTWQTAEWTYDRQQNRL